MAPKFTPKTRPKNGHAFAPNIWAPTVGAKMFGRESGPENGPEIRPLLLIVSMKIRLGQKRELDQPEQNKGQQGPTREPKDQPGTNRNEGKPNKRLTATRPGSNWKPTADQQVTNREPTGDLSADQPGTKEGPTRDQPETNQKPIWDQPKAPKTNQGPTGDQPRTNQGSVMDQPGSSQGPTRPSPRINQQGQTRDQWGD